jgi:hypothetical protein
MGVAGDMFLGSLTDLAISTGRTDKKELVEVLEKSAVGMGKVRVDILREKVSGIGATGIMVTSKRKRGHHVKGREMKKYLEEGCTAVELGGASRKYAHKVLEHVLRAESKIHASTPEELHLHETGAPDTLVEIIGSGFLLERLDGLSDDFRFFSTPISVGMGSIEISHGVVPIPAPATMEILKDMPFKFGPLRGELATPTGVSLLKALAPEFVTNFSGLRITPMEIGYGFGKRKYDGRLLNVVRAISCTVSE